MADKQATVYIVDVGHSMGEFRNGRTESDLDYALKYVWDRITTTVSCFLWSFWKDGVLIWVVGR